MSLAPGVRLGAYEVLALIGAGGMGEVYKARDIRLDRIVAIKVLPASVAADPDLRQRFEREARAVAALNHPHICTLHDIGRQNGTDFLVMEYLDGETLADRLGRAKDRPLPLTEALTIAVQIADALDKAHRRGITHRDLKPGNIMLTKSGAKLLDFGLAKTGAPIVAGTGLSMLPTTPPNLTAQGTILGTFQYMAPEQLEGKEVDPRTDLFAFGAVLYEMLTGKRAFEGTSQASLIAAILDREPSPISTIQPLTPPLLDHIIKKCLTKNPDDRLQNARDLHDLLTLIAETSSHVGIAPLTERATRPLWWRVVMPAGAALAAVVVAGTAVWLAMRTTVPPPRVSRLSITPPSAAALTISGTEHDLAITPDGRRIVYTGINGTLFVRALDELDATALTGLGAPAGPFVSPDGQWIGFSDPTNLKKVAITGGPAVTLAGFDGSFQGATWGSDGTIVFATGNSATGLRRIGDDGGESTVLTRPDSAHGEADHLFPEFLPGGRAVLFTITSTTGGLDQAQVAVLDLQTGKRTTLIRGGSDAHYVPGGAASSGHLVYGAAGTLRSVAFDLAQRTVVGAPVPVVAQVVTTNTGAVDVAVGGDGTIVYVAGAAISGEQRTLVWVDRQGQETPIPAPPRAYDQPRISPDGTRVALHGNDQELDLWLWDLTRGALARLTSNPANDLYPVWTPDNGRLLFSSERVSERNLFAQAWDGTGAVTRLTESANGQNANSISPDGTRLVFTEFAPKTGPDVMQLELGGAHLVTPLVQTPFAERNGEVSPDGRWLAYEANDSGSFEIYVRPFPEVAVGRWQVSTDGGRQPLWTRNGQELFYFAPNGALMRVGVARGTTWAATAPARLLEGRYYAGTATQVARQYDVALDGRRFLMIKLVGGSESTSPESLVVVQHFDEELKRLRRSSDPK